MEQKSSLCIKCNQTKPLADFNKNNHRSPPVQFKCRDCERLYRQTYKERRKKINKRYALESKDSIKKYHQEWYQQNKPIVKKKRKTYLENNKQKTKETRAKYFQNNKEKLTAQNKEWQQNNRDRVNSCARSRYRNNPELALRRTRKYNKNNRAKVNAYRKQHFKNNENFQLRTKLNSRFMKALKRENNRKLDKTENLLGKPIRQFKEYLKLKFTSTMNWQDFIDGKIVIDHYMPYCWFSLKNIEEQKLVCHFANLRPIFPKENLRKSAHEKRIGETIRSLPENAQNNFRHAVFQNKLKNDNFGEYSPTNNSAPHLNTLNKHFNHRIQNDL